MLGNYLELSFYLFEAKQKQLLVAVAKHEMSLLELTLKESACLLNGFQQGSFLMYSAELSQERSTVFRSLQIGLEDFSYFLTLFSIEQP
jgi:hypothetical protein